MSPAGGVALSKGMSPSASEVNSLRICAVIDCLSRDVRAHVVRDATEFLNLCLSFSRGIDFCIANNEVPNRVQELPSLLKQVCRWNKNDTLMQAAIMVLMISVKNACQSGWFSDGESEELRNLANEIASKFGSVPNLNTEPSYSLPVISTIMSRFYPRLKMGHIYVFLEAKPGYEAYVSDFQISRNLKTAPGEKIRLFVVQTDSPETSSCLISPPKVDILLNGMGVDRRTNVFMDTGPQVPTVVTHLVKYGSNLLQAVGEFNGSYIIAIALMSEVPNLDATGLRDCEQHTPAIVDEDSEIIEGPSRISLNCPISFKRIKTPVKGHSCKHIQCYDFDNYVDINSRRPSWRCPHCNQHVCFTDIRIDQDLVKILKEVGPKVTDIIISSDGSWKAAMEIVGASKKSEDKTSSPRKDDSSLNENVNFPNTPTDILDLTDTDDVMGDVLHETEDIKPNPTDYQNEHMTQATVADPLVVNTSDVNPINHAGDDSWSRIYLSTFGTGLLNVQSNASPLVLLDSPIPGSVGQVDAFHANVLVPPSVPQNQMPAQNMMPLQQYQYGNETITNEYGRFPSLPRFVTRIPTAVQALPVQTSNYVLQQWPGNGANTFIQIGLPTASQNPVPPRIINPAAHSNPHVPQMVPSALHQYQGYQNVGHQSPNQVQHAYRVANERQPLSQQMPNFRMPQSMNQSPGSMQSPSTFLRPQNHVGILQNRVSSQQAHLVTAANRTALMAVYPSRMVAPTYSAYPDGRQFPSGDPRVNIGVTIQPQVQPQPQPQVQRQPPPQPQVQPQPQLQQPPPPQPQVQPQPQLQQPPPPQPQVQPFASTESYEPPDPNWRPSRRMRGALYGQAYSDALNQFIVQPYQQAQAARPIANVIQPSSIAPPQVQMQPFVADWDAQVSQAPPNYASSGPPSGPWMR